MEGDDHAATESVAAMPEGVGTMVKGASDEDINDCIVAAFGQEKQKIHEEKAEEREGCIVDAVGDLSEQISQKEGDDDVGED